jgi:hypothetical protein
VLGNQVKMSSSQPVFVFVDSDRRAAIYFWRFDLTVSELPARIINPATFSQVPALPIATLPTPDSSYSRSCITICATKRETSHGTRSCLFDAQGRPNRYVRSEPSSTVTSPSQCRRQRRMKDPIVCSVPIKHRSVASFELRLLQY